MEVGASGRVGDAELDVVDVVDDVPEDDGALVCEVAVCIGVDVEETNGGECWMYEPSGWTA